ncbi:CerR family C-terminal domain-containing protein [Gallaecimonas sp. GXIMD1310]|uniref:CerR family C-terminal domain-containing protein n=1 Tax=Gallaecimonas sp. GXIMD1310 TaxID=3131926 RepID=UPI003255A2BA
MPILDEPNRGDATRQALIATATDVFAHSGYDGVSTRAIARAAGINQALISYHFGSKEGLYLAVFEAIAEALNEKISPLASSMEKLFTGQGQPRSQYLQAFEQLASAMVDLMVSPQTAHWSQLVLREQQHPTKAFDVLYDRFMGRLLGLMTQLIQRLRPTLSETDARLLMLTLLGQVLVWRFARTSVERQMGWHDLDPDAIKARLFTNLRLLLEGDSSC